mgnify:CR=1 FL=1|jgi:protein-tyrosine phosphatase
MIGIMFVCHGNICRSPMAEFVLKDMVKKQGIKDKFFIASSATSTEEIDNPVHRGTGDKLSKFSISTDGKYAVQFTKLDYQKYDYIIGMDEYNIRNILRIIGQDPENKVTKLFDFSDTLGDIADPWYTGNFDETYDDIKVGCEALLKYISHKASCKNASSLI